MPFGSKRIISTGETDFLLDDIVPYVVVAEMLQSSPTQLRYLLHGRSEELRYTTFTIAKRRRGVRAILAPKEDLKSIQRRLSDLLQNRFSVKLAAHGFVRNRSICTNAKCHIGYRIVFKLDLKDFFPTINFGRVRGLFMADPFNASPNVATILAQICCHKGSLPQGAPSSPVVSNMVCYRLDAQLLRLARVHGCVYTRYADDITFSKRKGQFPTELAIEGVTSDFTVGKELRAIIEGNGFQIHPDKVHLHRNTTRQAVTGLIVNNRLNVPREFVRNIRAVICDWRKRGLAAAQATHHETFYPHQSRRRRKPTLPKIIEGRLGFLKIVKGPYDKVRKNLQRQFVAICPDYQATMERENRELEHIASC